MRKHWHWPLSLTLPLAHGTGTVTETNICMQISASANIEVNALNLHLHLFIYWICISVCVCAIEQKTITWVDHLPIAPWKASNLIWYCVGNRDFFLSLSFLFCDGQLVCFHLHITFVAPMTTDDKLAILTVHNKHAYQYQLKHFKCYLVALHQRHTELHTHSARKRTASITLLLCVLFPPAAQPSSIAEKWQKIKFIHFENVFASVEEWPKQEEENKT